VCLVARDRGGPTIAFQVLVYPVTDLTLSHPSMQENAEGYLLTAADMRYFADHYLGDTDPRHPHASPLHADDLSGLPPAFICTAEFDPLRDEGEAYAERLRTAGVTVELRRYDGLIHGFFNMREIVPAARPSLDHVVAALVRALA
jgi:acetyl esterase